MARYAKRPGQNPYSAKYFNPRGVDYIDWIICGHHPFLEARKVDNLNIVFDKNRGIEIISWDELPTIDPLTKEEVSPSEHAIHKQRARYWRTRTVRRKDAPRRKDIRGTSYIGPVKREGKALGSGIGNTESKKWRVSDVRPPRHVISNRGRGIDYVVALARRSPLATIC